MGSKNSKVTVGFHYYLDIHLVLGNGPIESIVAMKADGRYFYGPKYGLKGTHDATRDAPLDSNQTIFISDQNLFGGEEREGGFVGFMDVMLGGSDQPVNPAMVASIQSATGYSGAHPAYLGQSGVFFRGVKSGDFTGTPWSGGNDLLPATTGIAWMDARLGLYLVGGSFLWSAMNPYFKPPHFLVQDCSTDWYPSKAIINQVINNLPLSTLNQMNPAHIIHKILTNKSWAGGLPNSTVNTDDLTAVADTLYDEGFGMGYRWDGSTSKKQALQFVLDHINASLWVDLQTNQFRVSLIRDDYDIDELIELNPDNCRITEVSGRGLADTVNEVIVTYTDPETGDTDTVSVQDPANIAQQGRIVTTEKDYSGVMDAELAAKLAFRDLTVLSRPLSKLSIEVGRIGVDLPPGKPFKVNYPLLGFEDVVFRVVRRNLGSLRSGMIVIDAVQDVFNAPDVVINKPQQSQWSSTSKEPEAISKYKLTETPYAFLLQGTTSDQRAEWPTGVGFTQIMAKAPNSDSTLFSSVDVGSGESIGTGSFNEYAETQDEVFADDDSFVMANMSSFLALTRPEYAYLGDEIIQITAINGSTNEATVVRGLFDTTPAVHAAGTPIYMMGSGGTEFVVDQTEREDGEITTYRLLAKTSRGWFDYGSATNANYTMDGRYVRPYPPGSVTINGGFFPVEITGDVTVQWSHRDRVAQEDIPVDWFDSGDTGPEANTTYNVRLYDADAAYELIEEKTGQTGKSVTFSESTEFDLRGAVATRIMVVVETVRDGYTCLQPFSFELDRIPTIVTDPAPFVPLGTGVFDGTSGIEVTE